MKRLFLFLFYNFCKLLVKISFRIFYEEVSVKNEHYLRCDNPCILVSNHPSTITDPLHVAHRAKRMVHFLANAGLYKSKIGNWFFSNFYCIPIERPEDVGGRKIRNDASFAKAIDFLCSGGLLYIAPEGYSQKERRLGKIKTGTARIALLAEKKANYSLGLTIQATGLNYTNHRAFRSKVFIYVGEPIKVADYKTLHESDARAAVLQLTADLTERMRSLIIDTEDQAEDLLLRQLEEILQNSYPLPLEENFFRNKKILTKLRIYRDNYPTENIAFRESVNKYFTALKQTGLNDMPLAKEIREKKESIFFQVLGFLMGFPFFVYGWLQNFVANYLPYLFVKKMNMYEGYDSTIKIISGMIIYPLLYGIQIFLVHFFFHNPWLTGLYFITLFPLGLFAWWYRKQYIAFRQKQFWKKWKKQHPQAASQLLKQRATIVEILLNKLFTIDKLLA